MRWLSSFITEQQRRRALRQAPDGPLRHYLQQPLPPLNSACHELRFAALDFETSGLNPQRDRLLSIGVVPFDLQGIQLAECWHKLVRSPDRIPERSAIIHGITDERSADGMPLQAALERLLETLSGRILVVHHGAIELGFLTHRCRRLYQAPFVARCIDTEVLGKRYLQRRDLPIRGADLRLFNLRSRFNLPRYRAHNALSDALATAELFLAMTAALAAHPRCRLKDFL